MPLPAIAFFTAALPMLPAPPAPAFLRVEIDGAIVGFDLKPVPEFEDALVEIRDRNGVEVTANSRSRPHFAMARCAHRSSITAMARFMKGPRPRSSHSVGTARAARAQLPS